jgi:hypothetical protein
MLFYRLLSFWLFLTREGKRKLLFICFIYIIYISNKALKTGDMKKDMKFTTSYYDDYDYESKYGQQPEGFDTIEGAVKWNEERNIPIYLVSMTEWDLDHFDYRGIPGMLQQGNLESWKYNDLRPLT